jgi:hypothetical protein
LKVGGGKAGAACVSNAGLSSAGWMAAVEVGIGGSELALGEQAARMRRNTSK